MEFGYLSGLENIELGSVDNASLVSIPQDSSLRHWQNKPLLYLSSLTFVVDWQLEHLPLLHFMAKIPALLASVD